MQLRFPSTLAAALVLLAACSDDPAGPGGAAPARPPYDIQLEAFTGHVEFSWGRSATDLYAGTNMILHFDGRTWTPLPFPDESSNIFGGWNLSDGSIAYWNSVRVYRFNGARWDFISFPNDRNAVWGFPTGEVFASTWNGDMCHYDGALWACEPVASETYMTDIHGISPYNVYAIAWYGWIAHFDGTSWNAVQVDSSLSLRSVCGAGDGSAFVTYWRRFGSDVFSNAPLANYAGGDSLIDIDLGGFQADNIHGAGDDLYVTGRDDAGRAIFHYDGATWNRIGVPSDVPDEIEWATPDEVYAAGYSGLWRIHAGEAERILGGLNSDGVTGLWSSPEGDAFAIGSRARRFDGTRWIDLNKEAITNQAPAGVHGSSSRDVWAVGSGMILHYDGNAWAWVSGGFQKDLRDVWTDGRRVLAVGRGGSIVSLEGTEWTLMESPTTATLEGVTGWDGGAFAVGHDGVMLRHDGTRWRVDPSPVTWSLYDVVAVGPDRMIVVGENPREILEYRAGAWRATPIESYYDRGGFGENRSVWANSATDFYVAQYGGDIHHFHGRSWNRLPRVIARGLQRIAVLPDGNVMVASESALLRYRPR